MKVNAKQLNNFLKKLTLAKRIEVVALEPYKGKLVCVADASEEVTIIASSDIDWDEDMEPIGVTLKNLSTFLATQGDNEVDISVEDTYYLVLKGKKSSLRHHLTDIRYVDTYLEDQSGEYLEAVEGLELDVEFEDMNIVKDMIKLLKASKDPFMYFMSDGESEELIIGSGNSNSDVLETKINMLTKPESPVMFKVNREDFLKVMAKVKSVFFTFSIEEGEPSTLLITDKENNVTFELWEKE